MAKFEVPVEPAGPVWTSFDGVALRWTRLDGMWYPDNGTGATAKTWLELLGRYRSVSDHHPDFENLPPLPWSMDGRMVRDAEGAPVLVVDAVGSGSFEDDERVAEMLVRFVNAHVSTPSTSD